MTKLTVAFRNFRNAPKKQPHGLFREATGVICYNDDDENSNNNNNNNNVRSDPPSKLSANLYDIYHC